MPSAGSSSKQINPDFFINGQQFWGLAMLASSVVYILVSLLWKRSDFNMDKMLHRGVYAIQEETKVVNEAPSRGLKMLGMGKEFTLGDKIIYIAAYTWTFAWVLIFLIGTWFNLSSEVSDGSWMAFWRVFIIINTVASVFIIVWFTIGGTKDLREMLKRLATATRNHQDDGFVKKRNRTVMFRRKHAMERSPKNPILTRDSIPPIPPELVDVTSVFQPRCDQASGKYILLTRVQSRSREPFSSLPKAPMGNGSLRMTGSLASKGWRNSANACTISTMPG